MSANFIEQLELGCTHCEMRHKKILIGLSGGPDSVALTLGLKELQSKLDIELHAAHLNHQLRGPESDTDQAWVQAFCDELNIPLFTATEQIEQIANDRKESVEATARKVRYEFLKSTAQENFCQIIAIAHHADDQAETILHQLIRGSGLRGLIGMSYIRDIDDGFSLVRPMLEMKRFEVEAALTEWKQDSLTDGTNHDFKYTRNRIRHELIPELRETYNPRVSEALINLSQQAKESQELIEHFANEIINAVLLEQSDDFCRLDKIQLAQHPRHLIRECLVQLWCKLSWPRQQMGFSHWNRLAGAVLGESQGCSLPGPVQAKRVRKELHLIYRRKNNA